MAKIRAADHIEAERFQLRGHVAGIIDRVLQFRRLDIVAIANDKGNALVGLGWPSQNHCKGERREDARQNEVDRCHGQRTDTL